MRITLEDNPDDDSTMVFLNGNRVDRCIEADTEKGYTIRRNPVDLTQVILETGEVCLVTVKVGKDDLISRVGIALYAYSLGAKARNSIKENPEALDYIKDLLGYLQMIT